MFMFGWFFLHVQFRESLFTYFMASNFINCRLVIGGFFL
jgi:hypothetical protein